MVRSEHDRLLLHVVDGINRTLQLKEVLRKCMEAAKVVMNAEASSLMLLDELTGDLNVSLPTGPVKDEIIGMAVPKNKGIGGWVISYNQPFISNDVVESDIFWKDLSTGFTTRNIICVPLQDAEGKAFGVLQAINKKEGRSFLSEDVPVFEALAIHVSTAIERSRRYDELENRLADHELQLEEIHHRLKNSLSMISGLLEFDMKETQNRKVLEMLSSANTRIRSLADAHSLLSEQQNVSVIDLSQYLKMVAQGVEKLFNTNDKDVYLNTRLEEVNLAANRSMLCGLILNELLINAYKHAFKEMDSGELVVSLKKTEKNKAVMIVTDNGSGEVEEKPAVKDGKPNGKYIVQSLVNKLEGDITYTHNPEIGSTCILSFLV